MVDLQETVFLKMFMHLKHLWEVAAVVDLQESVYLDVFMDTSNTYGRGSSGGFAGSL